MHGDPASQLCFLKAHICMQVTAYRNGSAYQLWQLYRLAKESDCQKILLAEHAISTLVPLLADEQLAAGSASILQRLATEEGADSVLQTGKHPPLVTVQEVKAMGACGVALQLL